MTNEKDRATHHLLFMRGYEFNDELDLDARYMKTPVLDYPEHNNRHKKGGPVPVGRRWNRVFILACLAMVFFWAAVAIFYWLVA